MADSQVGLDHPNSAHERPWNALLRGIARGDAVALASLYDGSSTLVYSVAFHIVNNRLDAEEITLDVFMYVWQSAAMYDPCRGTVTTWLVMLARSRAIERRRRFFAGKNGGCIPHDVIDSVGCDLATARALVIDREQRILVEAALHQLPPKDQELIQYAFYSGFSHVELAAKLQIPLGTVKSRIRTILSRLRDLIK